MIRRIGIVRRSIRQSITSAMVGASTEVMLGSIRLWVRSLGASRRLHQPVPAAGLHRGIPETSGAGRGSEDVLHAIIPVLQGRTVLDIGSNSGYFCFELGKRGYAVTGIEPDPLLRRVAAASLILDPSSNFSTIGDAFPGNNSCTFKYDNVLCLSVFQQWAEQSGYLAACAYLRQAFSQTNQVLVFSMPNTLMNRKIEAWIPPMGKTPTECRAWIENLLLDQLGTHKVQWIGQFPSDFRPDDLRDTFVVRRS